jgi:hypothetical protein
MASYGSDDNTQILAFGAINNSLDTKTAQVRSVATSIINSHLNIENDIVSPSTRVNDCCNMLAAAILRSKPGENTKDSLWEEGMILLEKLKGDAPTDAKWRTNIPVERFRGISIDDDRAYRFVK